MEEGEGVNVDCKSSAVHTLSTAQCGLFNAPCIPSQPPPVGVTHSKVGRFVALRKAASASVPEVESAKTKLGGEMGRVFTVDELAKFTG